MDLFITLILLLAIVTVSFYLGKMSNLPVDKDFMEHEATPVFESYGFDCEYCE